MLVAAPASGHGKTSLTAALARLHRRAGRRVRCFKTGPDFIDPTMLVQASGQPVYNLDTWMMGVEHCRALLHAAARDSDLILVEGAMGLRTDLPLSVVARSDAVTLPSRHLGLQIADEIVDLDERIDALADLLAGSPLAALPPPMDFAAPADAGDVELLLDGATIAVACDAAFCFLYQANLEWLQRMGAHLHVFSPLDDTSLPEVDAIYLPGGYPELHAARLTANVSMRNAICAHANAGKPLLAECGGMLYLADELRDLQNVAHPMLGLLPGCVTMAPKLTSIGPQRVDVGAEHADRGAHTDIRGHTFHYSRFDSALEPAWRASTADGRPGEAVYCVDAIVASYVHWYFASNPRLVARWFSGAALEEYAG